MTVKNRVEKRTVNGILLLDKPIGLTSNAALQTAKHLFAARKAGHTGSLDPLATGLLPLCFGEATKFSQYLLAADKSYRVTARLGIRTETGDAEGNVVSERPIPAFTKKTLDPLLDQFRGHISQVPSMYSALKYKGQPLYRLARQGITVERESRQLTIHRLDILSTTEDTVQLELDCTKGTYVRTLVDDFGEQLGCGAHVIELRRLSVGGFNTEQMVSLDTLEQAQAAEGSRSLDRYLLPIESAVAHWPALAINDNSIFYLQQGNSIVIAHAPSSGWVRFMDKQGRFLGVGEMLPDGKVAPRRLLKKPSAKQ